VTVSPQGRSSKGQEPRPVEAPVGVVARGAFTDWENHLPAARAARTKAPLRRVGVWVASFHRPKF